MHQSSTMITWKRFSQTKRVGIRRLFSDPSKGSISLYVLIFLNKAPPQKIKVGYCKYRTDKYISNPLRSNKRCRYGHMARMCRSVEVRSKRISREHAKKNCSAISPKSANCRGNHECPVYKKERYVDLQQKKTLHLNQPEQLLCQDIQAIGPQTFKRT